MEELLIKALQGLNLNEDSADKSPTEKHFEKMRICWLHTTYQSLTPTDKETHLEVIWDKLWPWISNYIDLILFQDYLLTDQLEWILQVKFDEEERRLFFKYRRRASLPLNP